MKSLDEVIADGVERLRMDCTAMVRDAGGIRPTAEAAGVSRNTVRSLLRGRPMSNQSLVKIYRALSKSRNRKESAK